MKNFERLLIGNTKFATDVARIAASIDGAPKLRNEAIDWLLLDYIPDNGPWPKDCNPEQCPHVATLFDEIGDTLNDKSGDLPENQAAIWDAGAFYFAARRIRSNVKALLEEVRRKRERG